MKPRVLFSILGLVAALAVTTLAMTKKQSASTANSPQTDTVWVAKPDGAQSCSPDPGKSLEADANELKRAQIRVIESHKANDKKMHAQMCGMPKGTTNAYLIQKSDLPKAISLGFAEAPTEN